jgi:hypothetical protein
MSNGQVSMPEVQGRSAHSMLACERFDAWACSDLYTVRCGSSCPTYRHGEREVNVISKKGEETMKPKKPKGGKGC